VPPKEPASRAAPRDGTGDSAPKFNDLMTAVYGDPNGRAASRRRGLDKPDSRGVTALMLAAMHGDAVSAEALEGGADPNRPGPGGDTATSIARERQNAAMVNLLQRYGGK
jgi:hypothetical protein